MRRFHRLDAAPAKYRSSSTWVRAKVVAEFGSLVTRAFCTKRRRRNSTQARQSVPRKARRVDSYPLRVDLDFAVRLGQLHDMTAEQARLFMRSASGTPLASRFLLPICGQAQDRRWRAFLDVLDEVPVMPELQCYYYQAQLAVGDRREA